MEFANLARTFEELERTSSRLTMIELVTQLFSSIERPEEIQQVCYLMQGRVAPFYEALEMGMADKSVTKSIALASHSTPEQIAALYATLGDLGLVAEQVQGEIKRDATVLSVGEVFEREPGRCVPWMAQCWPRWLRKFNPVCAARRGQ